MLNFNSSNKSLKMYTNTLSSISGDDLTIKPYDGQTLVLEVSANNNIFIKKGDVSYNLSNLITGAISSNISSSYDSFSNIDGSYASFSNIDVNGNVNPLNDATKSLGGGWGNEYNYTIDTFNGTRSQHKTRAESVPNRYLAVILNASDNNRVRDLIIQNSLPWVWIGGIRLQLGNNGTSSHWKWVTEQPWSYTNWDGGEPGSSEDSVKMHSNGFWHDWGDGASSAAVYITYNSKRWGNAYIRDVSTSNISISGTISVSGNILNVRQIIPQLNINTSLGTDQNTWQKAYIRELINITKINGSNWPITESIGQTGQTGPTGPTGPAGLPLVATQRVYQHLGKPIYEITTTYMSWQEHNVAALSQGKTLAVILNTEQMEMVKRLIVGQAALIGAFRTITSNATGKTSADWQWVTGDTWSYTNFAGGEPNTSYEYYLEMYSSGTWNDTQGTGAQRAIYMYYVNDPTLYGPNGYYGLAKDAYPSLNPLSSGVKAVQTWTLRQELPEIHNIWSSVCWSPELGLFVAVGYIQNLQSNIITSPDGINWTPRISPEANQSMECICWSPQLRLFVAVGYGGINPILTSPNGIIWTGIGGVEITNRDWTSVCWSPELGIFVAVGNSGFIITSFNGSIWTQPIIPESNEFSSVCWSPELKLFVVIARGGNTNIILISNNGVNWTSTVAPQSNYWTCVCWSPQIGLFAAVSQYGINRLMTSTNGINWTLRTIPVDTEWNTIFWCADLKIFVALAIGGPYRVLISPDGITWTLTAQADQAGWKSICWSSELGIAVAVGMEDAVMTSSLKGCPPTSYNVFGNETYTINTFTTSGTFTPTFSGTIEVLLVGGGGGGGRALGGGGGGGGVVHLSKVTVTANTSYSIVVGNGGPSETNGQNTTAFGATAAGGGTSGTHDSGNGISGGSGGGAASNNSRLNQGGETSGNIIGANNGINNVGTIHGKPGGNMTTARTADPTRAAGGGGAGAPGLDTNSNVLGDTGQYGMGSGGEGIINNILGSSYYWGGGGGGSGHSLQFGGWGGRGGGGGGAGSSGQGGGGAGIGGGFAINSGANGGSGNNASGGAGGANTGGGGGGGNWFYSSGGSGGSGIVIIRYSTIRPNEIDETGKWTFNNVLIKQPLVVNTTTYTSDDRLKHNEIVIANGLDVIDQLSPKFYQKTQVLLDASYNGDLSDYAWIREAGLIAQELLQISDLSFTVGGGDYYEEKYNLITQTNTISNYYDASSSYYDASSSYYDASSSYYDVSNSYYEISKNLITRPYNVNYNSVFVYGLAAIKELHTKVKAQETSSLDEQINNLVTRVEALELIVD